MVCKNTMRGSASSTINTMGMGAVLITNCHSCKFGSAMTLAATAAAAADFVAPHSMAAAILAGFVSSTVSDRVNIRRVVPYFE
eukprot:CAMPEP_0194046666 /NCGR_PEP_ID=MMETSP0009_2-20130614/22230_1 /TAXON_ID=210454 /ORGANISM="Grammatophora oceanica, Strain CCMP 410" /LENGTH=82 /DNA_ID=CAMNT_0038692055 /DNA_START=126 /DNA_END=375 /DNA_ORIENTATION=-